MARCLTAISSVGTAAYLLRMAENCQIITLGSWCATVYAVAFSSTVITSSIGVLQGVSDVESWGVKSALPAGVRGKSVKSDLSADQTLVLLKLAADVSMCAWAILELAVLSGMAVISAPILSGALVVCCTFAGGAMGYEFFHTGQWAKIRAKVDGAILSLRKAVI